MDVSRAPFIAPAIPRLRRSPPSGEAWLHEVKLDGFRVQLHKHGRAATIYSKNGASVPASSTASSWQLALRASRTFAHCCTGGRAEHAGMPSI